MNLTYDPADHAYYMDGKRVPGVSAVIQPLKGYMGRNHDAADRGQRVHEAIDQLANGFEPEVEPEDEPYVDAYRHFATHMDLRQIASEMLVGHPAYRFAGRLDWFGGVQGDFAIIDFKTGQVPSWVAVQLAGYAGALVGMKPKEHKTPPRRLAVQLKNDGTYRLHEYKDYAGDFDCFLGLLRVWRWQQKNGGTA